jgi:hypothetical protein
MLLSQYLTTQGPDALYKLGKVQCMKGNRGKAKEYLDRSSAVTVPPIVPQSSWPGIQLRDLLSACSAGSQCS